MESISFADDEGTPLLKSPLTSLLSLISDPLWLVGLTLATALFPLFVFPATGIAPGELLDLRFHYDAVEAHRALAHLTPEQRSAYLSMSLGSDLAFPVCYSLALCSALGLACHHLAGYDIWRPLLWLPLLIIPVDWAENLSIAGLLIQFPQQVDWLADLAGFFTALKWALLGIILVLMALIGLRALRKYDRS